MVRLLGIVLWAGVALAGETGASAHIVGGTVAELQSGRGRIELTRADAMVFAVRKGGALSIPYERIHTLEYGQRVSRRYAESILISPVLLLAKSRKHFITVGFTDTAGHRQVLVFRVGKGDIRAVLAGLEAKTGRRVEYQDEEARKSGGG